MNYLDQFTVDLIGLVYIIILCVFLLPLTLDLVADFFHKVITINKKNNYEK